MFKQIFIMRKIVIISILLFPIVFFSCTEKKLNILILGNSITHHVPDESIGWKGNWGMAASAADKDFESLFTEEIKKEYSKYDIKVTAKNIAVWEGDFKYDLNQFPDILNQKYDILIIRLGENVNIKAPDFTSYEKELNQLINRFKSENTKVIITGTVWSSPEKDLIQEKIAKENNYFYIPLLDFQADPKNYATGKFANEQVAAHPSDYGMQNIAKLLVKKVEDILQ